VLGRLYAEFVQTLISEYDHPKIFHETLKRRCIPQAAEKESSSHFEVVRYSGVFTGRNFEHLA
jgi:hypothetical protein